MENFEGETVLVTGAAQGVGYGLAHGFAKAGAKVVITDVNGPALKDAAERLGALTEVAHFELDVRDRERWVAVADEVEGSLGGVSVLCNNAAVAGTFALKELTYALWDASVQVNLVGAINGIQTFLPRMLASGKPGHIVNTSSAAGLVAGGNTTGAPYDTTKFALVGLSESLSRHAELVEAGIGVSVLCAGPVATQGLSNSRKLLEEAGILASDAERDGWWNRKEAVLNIIGLPPEEIGEMVVAAVRKNQLYVHTDRSIADAIATRGQQILDALPEETEHDRRMARLSSPGRAR